MVHGYRGVSSDPDGEREIARLDYLQRSSRRLVSVSLYAESVDDQASEKIRMDVTLPIDEQGKYQYAVKIFPRRPLSDYTARIIPGCENISVPLENNLIYWQR